MFLEINIGLRKMKRKANVLAKWILGFCFLNPKYLKSSSGNLTQFRVPFNSPTVTNTTHQSGKIQHLSLVQKDTDQQRGFQRTLLKTLKKWRFWLHFYGAGDWTQSFTLAKHAFYLWAIPLVLKDLVFEEKWQEVGMCGLIDGRWRSK